MILRSTFLALVGAAILAKREPVSPTIAWSGVRIRSATNRATDRFLRYAVVRTLGDDADSA